MVVKDLPPTPRMVVMEGTLNYLEDLGKEMLFMIMEVPLKLMVEFHKEVMVEKFPLPQASVKFIHLVQLL